MRVAIFGGLLTCCAVAGWLGHAVPVFGQGPDSHGSSSGHASQPLPRPPYRWWSIDKYRQELKLTAEQSQEIEKIFQASIERLRADKDDFDRAQASFSELMQRNSVPERDFQRAVDQLELARYNVSKERTSMLVRIHNVLTPEQRKGLEAIRRRNDGDKNRPH